jgi:hypothetical protein
MNLITAKIAEYRQADKPHTWRTVLDLIQEMGFDQDEYFHLFPTKRNMIDQPIWNNQKWISVFWVVGGSEGYYVHIANIWSEITSDHMDHTDLIILGKFWDRERAEQATQALQYFINFF